MKSYVLGFAFSHDSKQVYLIRKKHPAWQAGKLNGIGGKIEKKELPKDAMTREFAEEAGVEIDSERWDHRGVLRSNAWGVCVFSCQLTKDEIPRTCTDEEIVVVKQKDISVRADEMISNVPMLIYGCFAEGLSTYNLYYME